MLMAAWCEAIMRHIEFRQQMDPMTGEFTQADPSGYSPAALVFLDFARRLGQRLRWLMSRSGLRLRIRFARMTYCLGCLRVASSSLMHSEFLCDARWHSAFVAAQTKAA